jgi:hypothetical protein
MGTDAVSERPFIEQIVKSTDNAYLRCRDALDKIPAISISTIVLTQRSSR